LPQDFLLAARAQDNSLLASLSLTECIECGCCDVVCPSHIPLTETFRRAKPAYRRYEQQLSFTDAADERYHSRTSRLADSHQAAEQHRAALKQSLETEREREIRAAVERARQRRTKASSDDD
jgi:electron transport complex protein RnfC